MLNHIWLALILIGVTTAALLGRMGNMVDGMLKQAKGAVLDIALPLAGIMMLFLGMMRLAEKAGLVSALSRFLRPIFGRLFPDV
ncbi:MAG: nucleoside recognition protein, partial [Verrucomicrobiales bacterium]